MNAKEMVKERKVARRMLGVATASLLIVGVVMTVAIVSEDNLMSKVLTANVATLAMYVFYVCGKKLIKSGR